MRATADLPVCVDLQGRLGDEVAAFVEAELGWQLVDAGGPLVPSLTLAPGVVRDRPTIVVAPAPVAPADVRTALLAGALDVIAWPDERLRLLEAPLGLRTAPATAQCVPVLRVAGCRGGVGTSTVALAVAGTVAWSGHRALVVGDDAMLRLTGAKAWDGPGSAELAALGWQAAGEVEHLSRPVESVPGLRVLGGGANVGDTGGWPFELVVADVGRALSEQVDLVVGAADAALADAPARVPVVVVEHGPLDRAGVRARLQRPPAGWLPYSARVARAGCNGRVPSSLPGSWIAALRGALRLR